MIQLRSSFSTGAEVVAVVHETIDVTAIAATTDATAALVCFMAV